MLAIQVSIGALNDLVDARRDATGKPGKPIPSGLASPRAAIWLTWVAGALGILLSVPSGLPTGGVIGLGLVLGYLYDLRLSRTAWSWLPLALALPIVPIHAWLGSTGGLPIDMVVLYPAAVAAGGALALANGLVDVERDAGTARPTVVVALGVERAWLLHAGLLAVLSAVAVLLAPSIPPIPPIPAAPGGGDGAFLAGAVLQALRTWGVVLGIAALGLGAVALRAARPALRERGWELEAVGVGVVGIGWLAGIAGVAAGGS